MAKALTRQPLPTAEEKARKTLLGGACLLVLGLALVGVGQGTVGGLPVIVGLATTIGAIHVFGRLGPDGEIAPAEETAEETEGDSPPPRPRRTKARVEKRRRMDKSPAP